ncbi:hypothetical protein FACS1894164_05010 [Spirochaetia bacterium]|nr:hypothetical protein FACS1894164_05010 [Spirochaetia bacterium]
MFVSNNYSKTGPFARLSGMKKTIMILGAGVMQGPALRIAAGMGLWTVAVDGDPDAPCKNLANQFVHIDLKEKESIADFAGELQSTQGLDGVMTAGTDFSGSVAFVAEKLHLPGIPYEVALNASDKSRMRQCFEHAGVPSPHWTVADSAPESLPFPYPVVVKPVDNMGARGCRRVDSYAELHDAVTDAVHFSRSGRAIIEEYMDGPEFSVDAIVYQGDIHICGIADRHIYFEPYFIEMGHTMPTALSPEYTTPLLETFKKGVRALGIGNGAAKGDLKLTAQGPMIGEIAARLSGGYMSGWTYPYSSGVEVTEAAIQIALGENPNIGGSPKKWTSAERAVISIPGTVSSIQGIEEAQKNIQNLFMRIKPGDHVRFPENNVTKCANVISAAASREEAISAAENAVRSILIRLNAPDPHTEQFLARIHEAFPPDAFPVTEKIRKALEALPESVGEEESIVAFPALSDSGITDYVGRSVGESLDAVRSLTGYALPVQSTGKYSRGFWSAFIRGGYQGAAYFIDRINYFLEYSARSTTVLPFIK